MRKSQENGPESHSLPATAPAARLEITSLKPGDYPLGSPRSRAAARRMLEQRHSRVERREVILGCGDLAAPKATEWGGGNKDGVIGRIVSLPEGITIAEGLRLLGGYSEYELQRVAEQCSEPIHSCSIYTLHRS